jgi:glycosyltransferase domain-containing protein
MLTLILPTRNRTEFLLRLLRYYADLGFRVPIVIADSSDGDAVDATRRNLDRLPASLTVGHRTFAPTASLVGKVESALEEVRTPYVVIGADDDFHVPGALQRAVAFLDANPQYSLVHGDAVLFGLRAGAGTIHGEMEWLGPYPQRTIEHLTGAARLTDHLRAYTTTWYSVQRTEDAHAHYREPAVHRADIHFGELLPSCLSIIQGRSRKLGELYMARQGHSGMSSAIEGRQRDLFDWVSDPEWAGQYARFRDCLASRLVRGGKLEFRAAQDAVKQAFRTYLASVLGEPAGPPARWLRSRIRHVARGIPGVAASWRAIRAWTADRDEPLSLPALLRSSAPGHAAFTPIYRAVRSVPADGGHGGASATAGSGLVPTMLDR